MALLHDLVGLTATKHLSEWYLMYFLLPPQKPASRSEEQAKNEGLEYSETCIRGAFPLSENLNSGDLGLSPASATC